MIIKVEKRFHIPIWNEYIKRDAIAFWERRRIQFKGISDEALIGRRGNLFGNLTSFDMSKLISTLTITISEANDVHCILEINTIFQQVTNANRIWWDVEMEAFESFLLNGDEQKAVWKSFQAYHKKAAWKWVIAGFVICCLAVLANMLLSYGINHFNVDYFLTVIRQLLETITK